jgi:hypothetical protein
VCAAGGLILPAPASADHGYQTYRFKNTIDKPVEGIRLFFDREISHVEKTTWPGRFCEVDESSKRIVECWWRREGDLPKGARFKISVATPPAESPPLYVEAKLEHWWWFNRDGRRTGKSNRGCSDACAYSGVTSPSRVSRLRP